MCVMKSFMENLYKFLTDSNNITNQVVKLHTKDLRKRGDISFPLDLPPWHAYKVQDLQLQARTIFEVAGYKGEGEKAVVNLESLIKASHEWSVKIASGVIERNTVMLRLQKPEVFDFVVKDVLVKKDAYGAFNFSSNIFLLIAGHIMSKPEQDYSLGELRVVLLKKVCERFLRFVKFTETKENPVINIIFSNKAGRGVNGLEIICGQIIVKEDKVVVKISAEDFLAQRIDDMRMMAEHKYLLRVNSQPGWKEFFHKLGDAAVHVDLLRNYHKRATTIHLNDHYVKTASFILYNCARISQLLKQFHIKVEEKIYTPLPKIEEVDLSLLTEPEEWELIYVYVLRFPELIKRCFHGLAEGQVEVHILIEMLSKMTAVFSSYYRRVRILRESREYLLPILHARIFLVQAVQQVIINALFILDIEPVTQM